MTPPKKTDRSEQLTVLRYWEDALSRSRYGDARRLARFGSKAYSQADEDGIIAEIFNRIGAPSKTFFEFGVGNGLECNSLWLLVNGWSGVWAEGDPEQRGAIARMFAPWLDSGKLALRSHFITAENVNDAVRSSLHGRSLDLLSIDVDGIDFWIWKSLTVASPRVVVVEYNASWPPPASIAVPYDAGRVWDRTNYFGASIAAFAKLGEEKGYSLVGCSMSGINAFFVRDDLLGDKFFKPGDAAEHYEPPRYFMTKLPAGHPPGIGPLVEV